MTPNIMSILTNDPNWNIALAGCAVLALFWISKRKSGKRGLLLALTGCATVIAAVPIVEKPARLTGLVGVIVAAIVICAIAVCCYWLARRRRRRGPRYVSPDFMVGRCSTCGYNNDLTRTKHGWLCVRCQTKKVLAGSKL